MATRHKLAHENNISTIIDGKDAKTTPHNDDVVGLVDSEAAGVLKKLTWTNIKATLKTYFDTLYATAAQGSTADSAVQPTGTPVDNDFAKFTDGNTVEGRSYAEVLADLGLDTSDSPQFTGIELGHASDTTLTRKEAGEMNIEGKQVLTEDNTVTMTNKRITPRVWSAASDATPDINSDDYDAVTITAQTEAITDVNVTGTPTNFQKLLFRIKDDGTAREITWGSDFEDGSVELPTTTVAGKTLLTLVMWDSVDSKWACEASGNRE